MSNFKNYRKVGVCPMRPYVEGEDLTGVSVNNEDTPGKGGMIAHSQENPDDEWYIGADYFAEHYEVAE